jgi:calcineurin-like phosphoesterase family protein
MPRRGRTGHQPRPAEGQRVPVRVLAVSDVPDPALLAGLSAVASAQLILACGDLPFDYLRYLMNGLDVPLVFVPGNHDQDLSGYRASRAGLTLRAGLPAAPPWPPGAISADGRVLDVAGLRVAGLGGCLRYSGGPNQYTDRQQARRALALRAAAARRRLRDHRGVDVLLTHAPPLGVGDGADPAHRGFRSYHRLIAALQPLVLLHGHVHPQVPVPSRAQIGPVSTHEGAPPGALLGRTVVRNVAGRHLLDIGPAAAPEGHRNAR